MSTKPSPHIPLSPLDFVEGGRFHHEIVGELGGGRARVVVISTDHARLHGDGPVVYPVSTDLYAVFYRKSFLDKVWEFVESALQGTEVEGESEMRMVGAVLNRAIVALYQTPDGEN